jgi:hypothetical protein
MKTLGALITILTLLAGLCLAQDRPYIEPRVLWAGGTGTSQSDLLNSPYKWELAHGNFGLSLDIYTPISDGYSLIVKPFYTYSRVYNIDPLVRQSLHRFGAEIGFRFYLK